MIAFDCTGSTREVPCAGETGRERDTLVEGTSVGVPVVGREDEAGRLLRGNAQLQFR